MDSNKELGYGANQWNNNLQFQQQQQQRVEYASVSSSDAFQHQMLTTDALHSIDASNKQALLQQIKLQQQQALAESSESAGTSQQQEHDFSGAYWQAMSRPDDPNCRYGNEYLNLLNNKNAVQPSMLMPDPQLAAPYVSCRLPNNTSAESMQSHFQNEALLQGLPALAGLPRSQHGNSSANIPRMISQNVSPQGRTSPVSAVARPQAAAGGIGEETLQGVMQSSSKQKPKVTRSYTKVLKLGSIGRSLDITRFSNYTELRSELAKMFELEGQLDQNTGWQLVYMDNEGDILLVGDDRWEEFVSSVRGIRIMSPPEILIYTSNEEYAGTPLSSCLTTKR